MSPIIITRVKNILLYSTICIFFFFSCTYNNGNDSLDIKIKKMLKSHEGTFAVAFKNLDDGSEILINENEEFHAASTMKTPR